MDTFAKSVAVLSLVLALAGCGGETGESQEAQAGPDAAATAALTEGMQASGTGEADDSSSGSTTPGSAASPAPGSSPSPTPSPSATTAGATPSPSPTPTRVASAEPPAAFAQCSACHAVAPGRHGIGPSLAGVFGKRAASQGGYSYSDALEGSGLTWNQANLSRFLADPMGTVPGTKMVYPGLKDAAQRQAVIDYMRTL